MHDKELLISKIKKLSLFTSINYLLLDDHGVINKDALNNKYNIELDDTDSVMLYKIENESLSLKGQYGLSYKSEDPLKGTDINFNFEKGSYIFLQVNKDYNDVNYFFKIIKEYIKINNLKISSELLIQRLIKEDGKTISQFCLKI